MKTKKKPKKYLLELTLKSVVLWTSGLFLLLVWIFILGVLVGRGYLSFDTVKEKIAEVHDMGRDDETSDLGLEKSDKDPKLAFYEELSSRKEAAARQNGPTVTKQSSRPKSIRKPDENSISLSNVPKDQKQYVLQIGSFTEKAKAVALVDRLTDRGYPTFFSRADVKGTAYFRVKCGPFKAEAEADEYKKTLAKKENIHGFVTRAEK